MRLHGALVAGVLIAVGLGSPTPAAATASQNSVCIAQFLSDKELAGNVGHSLGGQGDGLAPTIGGVGQILGGQGHGLAATNAARGAGVPSAVRVGAAMPPRRPPKALVRGRNPVDEQPRVR